MAEVEEGEVFKPAHILLFDSQQPSAVRQAISRHWPSFLKELIAKLN
jgi:hypothetical protein